MPIIYLSPSTQENNFYVSGGTEEEWMNRLADAMVPYLDASGIQYVRNTPEMTAAAAIRASNEGNYDLHLALQCRSGGPLRPDPRHHCLLLSRQHRGAASGGDRG